MDQGKRSIPKVNRYYKTSHDPGLYVDVIVNGTKAKFLVDTGASISLVSETLFEKFKGHGMPQVKEIKQVITAANGEPVKSIGKAIFPIQIGELSAVIEAVIGEVSVEEYLG